MSYTTSEGRETLMDDLGAALEQLAFALACLGEAYELVDERSADQLEENLFRPVRSAYARARRGLSGFAGRYGLEAGAASQPDSSGLHSADPRVYLERAIEASDRAESMIAELQDSLLPVEVGDQELREDLADVRGLLAAVPAHGQALLRTLGR
jgi:hypothetical protein